MADYIALDWEEHRISGVEASVSRSGTEIGKTFQFEWPEFLRDAQDSRERGEWLKTQLDAAGVSGNQVLVSLPRDNTVIRPLDLPDAPPEDIPDLVRFQAATKLTGSMDDLIIDFLPLPRFEGSPGIHVLLATVVRKRVKDMQATLEAAGLQMVSLGTSSGAAAELVARAERASAGQQPGLSLIVSRHGSRVELSLLMGTFLLFSHSTQLMGGDSADDNRSIYTEISRSRISLQRWVETTDIARAWLVGEPGENAELQEFLSKRLGCPVENLDPLTAPGVRCHSQPSTTEHSVFAGPIGMLLGYSESAVAKLDFMNPRKRPEVKDTRLQKAILAVAGVAVIGIAGLYLHFSNLSELEQDIERINGQAAEIKEVVKRGESNIAAVNEIDAWAAGAVPWLDTLRLVNATLTEVNADDKSGAVTSKSHRIYLTRIQLGAGGTNALAQVTMNGFARSGNDIEQLREGLRTQQLKVYPSETKWSTRDSEYLREFPLVFEAGSKPAPPSRSNRRSLGGRTVSR